MTKDGLKEWLFDVLNENKGMFKEISLNNSLDMLKVKTTSGQDYIIRVNNYTAKKKIKESYAVLSLSMSVLELSDLGIISKKKARVYLEELSQHIDKVEI